MTNSETIKQVLRDCRHIAMESLSDDNIPDPITRLIAIAEIDSRCKVHAIKFGQLTDFVPDGKVSGPLYQWHMRATTGKLLPGEPNRVKRVRPSFNLIVDGSADRGNPISLAHWFKDNGVSASATGPTCCQIVIADAEVSDASATVRR